jgi:YD repeat-containing protein
VHTDTDNTNGRLIAQEDDEGNRTDFSHDIAGRLKVITNR